MTWFKVDDSFYDHPKIFDAPDCAVALWTRAGCWSARNLTEGHVPSGLPARLCGDPDTAVRELVERGLWRRTKGGFQFHDWRVYQPTADEVRALKAKRAEAGRKGGLASGKTRRRSKTEASAEASGEQVLKQNATPSRPSPPSEGRGDARRSRDGGAASPRDSPASTTHPFEPDDVGTCWCGLPRSNRRHRSP